MLDIKDLSSDLVKYSKIAAGSGEGFVIHKAACISKSGPHYAVIVNIQNDVNLMSDNDDLIVLLENDKIDGVISLAWEIIGTKISNDPELLFAWIKKTRDQSFTEGKRAMRNEIAEALRNV